MCNKLVGPLDLVTPGLFLLGRAPTPASTVALGTALQELVMLLRMQEVQARVVWLSHALGAQMRDALALPNAPQMMVAAAYHAPRMHDDAGGERMCLWMRGT